jgi:3'(2'), 5'-bisphosphate nucleotidase
VRINRHFLGKKHLDLSPLPHLSLAKDILPEIVRIAWETTDLLCDFYHSEHLTVIDKCGEPQTNADLAADRHILTRLQDIFGESCGYLTEETYQPEQKACRQDWVWIIDPIDGTKDFVNKTGEYAVHIALVYQQRPLLAVVAIPEAELVYQAVQGHGSDRVNRAGEKVKLMVDRSTPLNDAIVIASRSHRSPGLEKTLAALPTQNQIQVGSVGGKIAAIIEHRADIYISVSSSSAPKDWDLAAPELILTEAGGILTNAQGENLLYNRDDVSQWGCLIASSGQWQSELCAYCLDSLS